MLATGKLTGYFFCFTIFFVLLFFVSIFFFCLFKILANSILLLCSVYIFKTWTIEPPSSQLEHHPSCQISSPPTLSHSYSVSTPCPSLTIVMTFPVNWLPTSLKKFWTLSLGNPPLTRKTPLRSRRIIITNGFAIANVVVKRYLQDTPILGRDGYYCLRCLPS